MATTNREKLARIAELEELLETGVTSVTVDGTTTQYDLEVVRRQLQQLRESMPGGKQRRPRAARINLGGF